MARTEAQRRAVKKWNDAHMKERYDRIQIVVPVGEKAEFQAAAEKAGDSLSAYIAEAVRRRMESERGAGNSSGDSGAS